MAGEVVLVCGGRDFRDKERVRSTLSVFHQNRGVGLLVHGGAGNKKLFATAPGYGMHKHIWHYWEGADLLAEEWAICNRVPFWSYKISREEWNALGPKAGPLRNQRMLDERHPTVCVAFPGGRGTADMVRRALAAGIEVADG